MASFHRVSILDRQGLPLSWKLSVAAVGLQGKHVQGSTAVRRKVSPSRLIYCLCQSGDEYRNPHKRSQQMDDKDENNGEPHEYEALDADSSAILLIASERNKQR